MLLSKLPLPIINVSILRLVFPCPMKLISAKHSLVFCIFRNLQNPYPMLHPTAPVSLILGSSIKIIMPIPVNFIFYEAAVVFFTTTIVVCAPSTFASPFDLALILISIIVPDSINMIGALDKFSRNFFQLLLFFTCSFLNFFILSFRNGSCRKLLLFIGWHFS